MVRGESDTSKSLFFAFSHHGRNAMANKKNTISLDFFQSDVLPAVLKGMKAEDDPKKIILAHLETKMIEVVDEDGNPVDMEATLVIRAPGGEAAADEEATEAKAEETPADKEDEAEKAKALNDAIAKAVDVAVKGAFANQRKTHVRIPVDAAKPAFEVKGYRAGQLKNFRGEVSGKKADERAYRFGMWCLAAVSKGCAQLHFPNAINFAEEHFGKVKLHQGNVNHSGGYLVPEEFGQDLIDLRETYGVVRRIFKNRPMSSDTRSDPRRASGLTAYFVTEGAAGTESSKGWDQIRLTARDLMVLTRYTNQLSEDAVINIGDDLAGEISYAFANKEDECGINGDGTSTYGGIIGVRTKLQDVDGAGTDSAGLVAQGTGSTWGAVVLADFNNVIAKLPQYADSPNAVWVAHRAFYHGVMQKLEAAAGGNTQREIREGSRQGRPLFLGYPVEISQVMPAATASAHVACLLGDFTLGASFGDRRQDAIAFSEHATIGGESVFERNEIAVRGTERFDINVHDVGSSAAAGPIVGLLTG